MRTTLTIDDDVMQAVKVLAGLRKASLSKTISDLARKALKAKLPTKHRNGFPVFSVPENAQPISPEDIKRFEDEPA